MKKFYLTLEITFIIVLFSFILATKANAHNSDCSAQWNSCTSPCTINIGIKGTAWYDDCMNQCSNQELACETALVKTSTSCFDQWNHCTSPCNTSIGIWGVSWYDGCIDFCKKQQTACENQTAPAPVNPQPTTQPTNCGSGSWNFNGSCVTKDQWCVSTYGANFHEKDGSCSCADGYGEINGACVTLDDWCRATYGNSHEENGECPCDASYTFFNGACITDNQWCKTTYGNDYYREGDFCVSKSQPVQSPVKKSITPVQQKPPIQSAKKAVKKLTNQEIQAITVYLFGAMGYDADDFDRAMETISDVFKTANGLPGRKELNNRALTKRKDADKEFTEAARDGRIKDSATRERIRKMYLDSWLDNPQDKKTDMMMAIFEKDNGHADTADVFEKFAYMNLNQKERNTLTAAVNKAKEGMSEKLMGEEVNRTLLQNQLDNSAVMNQLRQNVNNEIAKAKETAKDACYGNSACDWVWTKKVGIITEAQKLSQSVREVMNEPVRAIFGFDRKELNRVFYGKP